MKLYEIAFDGIQYTGTIFVLAEDRIRARELAEEKMKSTSFLGGTPIEYIEEVLLSKEGVIYFDAG